MPMKSRRKNDLNALAKAGIVGIIGLVSAFFIALPAHADTPFLGEINCGGWNFCPMGWAECNGQTMPISENDALYALIGTTYGGDGQQTFGLPNLMGRTMVHNGQGAGLTNRVLGQMGGVEQVTLTNQQMPAHTHPVAAHAGGEKSATPNGRIPGNAPVSAPVYGAPSDLTATNPSAVSVSGGAQPHNNLQPYLTGKCCIATVGIFPSRN